MKFAVEIDIEWIDEDGSLNDEVYNSIVGELTNRLEARFLKGISDKIVASAEKLITAKTELLINTVLERPVTISDGWKSQQEFESIFDMVEYRMSALYEMKINPEGTCEKDPLLSRINRYTDDSVRQALTDIDKSITKHSNRAANAAVDENEFIQKIKSVIESKS